MIRRTLAKKIIEYARHYPVVAVTGPRQSGKTTLVRSLFPKKSYLNLEDLETREFAEKDPKGLLGQYADGAVIDEAQRVPRLFSLLQTSADETRKNGQYILTGSQNFLLLEGITQSLAGRVAIAHLLPLAHEELAEAYKGFTRMTIDEVLLKGFYPKLFDQKMDVSSYYQNYIQTYVERDVRLIKNIENLSTFRKFLQLVAARVGQLLNITSLGNDCGINQATVKAWLSILEASFIIFLLQPHYKNFKKRVVKTPKIYFYDTGVLCALLHITQANQLKNHYLRGGIFESMVIAELLKHRFHRGLEPQAFFWRDKTGHEVDLVIERPDGLVPIEIKSGQTVASEFFDGIAYYRAISKQAASSYIVYGGDQTQKRQVASVLGWRDWPQVLNTFD